MRPILGNTSSEGKKPTTPTIGTASSGNAQATVTFTASTYQGKTNSGTYRATSTPGSLTGTCSAPCSSITVSGLSNGTAYTFAVQLETPYGVNSDVSASSNSVTPVAPPFFPFFPPFFPFFPFFPCFDPPGTNCGVTYICAGPGESNICGYEECMNFDSCGNFCGC